MEKLSPVILPPGQGKIINMIGRSLVFLASKEQTQQQWSCIEYTAPPYSGGPPVHYHKEMEEAFYVIDGILTANINGEKIEAGAGGFVNIPPYHLHTWENAHDIPLKTLLFMAPGGFENYFIEMNELIKTLPEFPPKDMTPFHKLFAKYDTYLPE
ncbi:MAG TPA: cupin domain-containing protein [Chitinophagaceae bacterium]|nr:cupin domain-containing protein [Chitinophagaceae bacterium]